MSRNKHSTAKISSSTFIINWSKDPANKEGHAGWCSPQPEESSQTYETAIARFNELAVDPETWSVRLLLVVACREEHGEDSFATKRFGGNSFTCGSRAYFTLAHFNRDHEVNEDMHLVEQYASQGWVSQGTKRQRANYAKCMEHEETRRKQSDKKRAKTDE